MIRANIGRSERSISALADGIPRASEWPANKAISTAIARILTARLRVGNSVGGRFLRMAPIPACPRLKRIILKQSDFRELHRGPEGSTPRMGRRNLAGGRRNGSHSRSYRPRQPPTETSHDRHCRRCLFGFILKPLGALLKPQCHLRRPMQGADPSGPFSRNLVQNRSSQVILKQIDFTELHPGPSGSCTRNPE